MLAASDSRLVHLTPANRAHLPSNVGRIRACAPARAGRRALPAELVVQLAAELTPEYLLRFATNPLAGAEALRTLANDPDQEVRLEALTHHRLPVGTMWEVLEKAARPLAGARGLAV